MDEKFYWAVAAALTAGILYVGVKFFTPLLAAFHVLVSLLLMLVVLLQSGRAADLAGAFGGAGSQTAFGPRGAATFLSKATTFLAVVFMATSLTLAVFASRPRASALAGESTPPAEQETTPPQQPEQQPQPPPQEQPQQQAPPPQQ